MQAVALVCGRSDLSSEQLEARNEGTGRQRWALRVLATAGLSSRVCEAAASLFLFPTVDSLESHPLPLQSDFLRVPKW